MYEKVMEDILKTAEEYGVGSIMFTVSNDNDVMMNVIVPKFNANGYMGREDEIDSTNIIMTKGIQ